MQRWQKLTFTCLADIYRQDERDRDPDTQSIGLRLVSTANPCKRHATDNFDEKTSIGQMKEQNIMTADKVDFALGIDVQDSDWLKLTELDGTIFWLNVQGPPKDRTGVTKRLASRLSYQRCYAIPDAEPLIVLDGNGNPKIYGGAP